MDQPAAAAGPPATGNGVRPDDGIGVAAALPGTEPKDDRSPSAPPRPACPLWLNGSNVDEGAAPEDAGAVGGSSERLMSKSPPPPPLPLPLLALLDDGPDDTGNSPMRFAVAWGSTLRGGAPLDCERGIDGAGVVDGAAAMGACATAAAGACGAAAFAPARAGTGGPGCATWPSSKLRRETLRTIMVPYRGATWSLSVKSIHTATTPTASTGVAHSTKKKSQDNN